MKSTCTISYDLDAVIKRLSPALRKIAYKAGKGQTIFDHEDLMQEAFLFLGGQLENGTLNDKTDSYILQGCFFHMKNLLRKSKVYRGDESVEDLIQRKHDAWEEMLHDSDWRWMSFLDELHNKFLTEAIYNNGLTMKEKSVLPLFAKGLTTRAVGQQLGISHVAVVKMMKRIRAKCLKHVDESGTV